MSEQAIGPAARPAPASELTVGDVRLAFVPDGSICLPPVPLYDGGTRELFAANRQVLDADGLLVMSLGSLLIESHGTRILVDLGWGPSSQDIPPGPDPTTSRSQRAGKELGAGSPAAAASSALLGLRSSRPAATVPGATL